MAENVQLLKFFTRAERPIIMKLLEKLDVDRSFLNSLLEVLEQYRGSIRGVSSWAKVGGTALYVARIKNLNITMSDIAKACAPEKISKTKSRKLIYSVYKKLLLKSGERGVSPAASEILNSLKGRGDFPEDVIEEASKILNDLERVAPGAARPTLVAAALYLTARNKGYKLTQKIIAEKLGITDASIRNLIRSFRTSKPKMP